MTTIDGEAGERVDEDNLPVVRQGSEITLFRTEEPTEIVARATELAEVLAKVLKDQKLTTNIKGREHVRVEGWTFCGTMLGVFPVCTWTRPVEGGWEARVEARTRDGAIVGAAEAECLRSESTWKNRDDYALRSMSQTRATSKAFRLPLGFIVSLAGFETTPAEEMSGDEPRSTKDDRPSVDRAQLGQFLAATDKNLDWESLIGQAVQHVYNTELSKLSAAKMREVDGRMSDFCRELPDPASMPPASREEIVRAFAAAFEGAVVEIPERKEQA